MKASKRHSIRLNAPLKGARAIGSNMTEVEHGDLTILYSYETPVAFLSPAGGYITDKFWSKTTSTHIGKFFARHGYDKKGAYKIPQDDLARFVEAGELIIGGPNPSHGHRPRRTRRRMGLLRQMQFFRSHAGGVVGEAAKGALHLARAEKYAREHGWDIELHPEEERYEDVYGDPDPGGEWVTVVLKDRHGKWLGSLGFVDARDDKYVRVVAAELAYEAMP